MKIKLPLIPSRKQWQSWSLPSRLTFIGTWGSLISLLVAGLVFFIQSRTGATLTEQKHLSAEFNQLRKTISPLEQSPVLADRNLSSEEFLHFVEILHKFLSDKNASIETNVDLPTRDLMQTKHIDILVEQKMGLHTVKIAIEVLSPSSTITATDIDTLMTKYGGPGGVVVDKVVVAAKHFSPGAIGRCRLFGFTPLVVEETSLTNNLSALSDDVFKTPLSNKENSEWVVSDNLGNKVTPTLITPSGKTMPPIFFDQGRLIHKKTKEDLGTPRDWAVIVLAAQGSDINEMYRKRAGEAVIVKLSIPLQDYDLQLYDKIFQIDHIVLDFGSRMVLPHFNATKTKLETSDSQQEVFVGRAVASGNEVSLIVEKGTNGQPPPRLYLDIRSLSNGTQNCTTQVVPLLTPVQLRP